MRQKGKRANDVPCAEATEKQSVYCRFFSMPSDVPGHETKDSRESTRVGADQPQPSKAAQLFRLWEQLDHKCTCQGNKIEQSYRHASRVLEGDRHDYGEDDKEQEEAALRHGEKLCLQGAIAKTFQDNTSEL